jgi:hypothetical protein
VTLDVRDDGVGISEMRGGPQSFGARRYRAANPETLSPREISTRSSSDHSAIEFVYWIDEPKSE